MASRQMPTATVANQVISATSSIERIPILSRNCSRTFLPHCAAARHAALDPCEGGVPDPSLITDKAAGQFSLAGPNLRDPAPPGRRTGPAPPPPGP
jgi:hypothetical protein